MEKTTKNGMKKKDFKKTFASIKAYKSTNDVLGTYTGLDEKPTQDADDL